MNDAYMTLKFEEYPHYKIYSIWEQTYMLVDSCIFLVGNETSGG